MDWVKWRSSLPQLPSRPWSFSPQRYSSNVPNFFIKTDLLFTVLYITSREKKQYIFFRTQKLFSFPSNDFLKGCGFSDLPPCKDFRDEGEFWGWFILGDGVVFSKLLAQFWAEPRNVLKRATLSATHPKKPSKGYWFGNIVYLLLLFQQDLAQWVSDKFELHPV